jgi:hypothetical protein
MKLFLLDNLFMKLYRLIYMAGIVLMLLSACGDSLPYDTEGQNEKP